MMPQRILILTSGPLCRNPRVLKEAQTLGRAGFDVTVMTVANIARFEAFDSELIAGAQFQKVSLDLITSKTRHIAERAATWMARRAAVHGWDSPQAFGPYHSLRRMARKFKADLTIVHTEIAFSIGVDLMEVGRRVAADFEDWHSEDLLPSAQSGRPRNLLRHSESKLMRHAAYTTAPSGAMARALQHAFGGPAPTVITNSFPLQPTPRASDRSDPPAFFWFSQTIGPGRGLERFLDAWALTNSPSRVRLLGDSSADFREALLSRVPSARRKMVEFLNLVPPAELPTLIAMQDIGLALEPVSPASRDLTITNKILQYVNAGLTIVATDTQGQREVFSHAPNAGILVDFSNSRNAAQQLDDLLASPSRLATSGAAARRAAESLFCWEREEPRLVEVVTVALSKPTPA